MFDLGLAKRGGAFPISVRILGLILVTAVVAGACPREAAAADFALRDGDTVVFLGDSITAARTYGKLGENYTLLRFPERKVHFLNAGWGGDTAEGGLKRLDRDVLDRGATVLIVARCPRSTMPSVWSRRLAGSGFAPAAAIATIGTRPRTGWSRSPASRARIWTLPRGGVF